MEHVATCTAITISQRLHCGPQGHEAIHYLRIRESQITLFIRDGRNITLLKRVRMARWNPEGG